ncbi:MAG: U32 family peptidase, partial [Clostridia bacterium]|nr:U32 family peptidase [Clostridia bacterium]
MKKIELLAPAGSYEALVAAVENGADAVYFGTSLFNARMMAKNFSREDVQKAVAYCHEKGVQCFVTMNTAITDRQMKDALNQVQFLYEAGVDALIVADLGLAKEIHKSLPDFPLHASTQCSAHNLDAVCFLKELGFSRVVVARELDKHNLRTICEQSPVEIEAFVHGALCVSQSGQCLFSSFLGGRSGNRGECAQPCRMMYNGKYPLSLKDLSLAEHITELCDMGVASLKIEGRMKSPDYVGRVVRIFRRLLDEGRNATKDEMASLAEIFSRSGFTDGYFEKQISPSMLGIRTERDLAATRRAEKQDGAYKNDREPITPPERAGKVTLDKAPIGKKGKAASSARFYNPTCIPADYKARGVEIAYLPLDAFTKGVANGVVLPPVIFDSEREAVLEKLKTAVKNGASHALVGNVGHIALAKEAGLILHGDWRFNIMSSY